MSFLTQKLIWEKKKLLPDGEKIPRPVSIQLEPCKTIILFPTIFPSFRNPFFRRKALTPS